MEAYTKAFQSLGYEVCDNDAHEPGFEKIAIYCDKTGIPKHAARQLRDGFWTSKCGQLEDIQHTLAAFHGSDYGLPSVMMRRLIESGSQ